MPARDVYRSALRREDTERTLYLAVTQHIYQQFFVGKFAQMVIEDEALKLLIFDVETEEIVEWIE